MPQWSVRNQAWVATPRPKIERRTPYDVATSRLSSRFEATSAGPGESQPLISPKSTRNHRWPPDAHELHNPSSPSRTSAAPIDTASPAHNPFLPIWKDAPPESLHKVASKSNVVANLWLKSQPLMEVAEPWAGTAKRRASYQMSVHKTYELDSDVVAHLRPFQRLRVLSTRTLPDGTERACIMLESNGKLLGWLTATTADGIANIHIYARPLYEVATPTKVREKFELTSKFVTQLEEGTKLHVVESRKLLEGTLRVCVMLVGNPWGTNAKCGPIGWITANRNEDGVRLIRETNVPHADSIPFRPRTASAFVGEHQRPKPARPFSTGLSERRLAQRQEADDDDNPRVSLTPRGNLADEFSEASSSSHRTPKSERSGGSGGPLGRTPAESRNSDSFRRSQKTSKSPTASNPTDAVTLSGVEEGVPSSAVETPTSASFKMKTAGLSVMKMDKTTKTAKEEGKKKSRVDELLPSGSIRKVANELFEKALDLETKAIKGRKPLTVQMGEALQKRKIVVADLMREWDPNGDGEISPMEFRQNVRKLLPTELHAGLVISEVDALFNDLDLDKSGALDVGEIKIALKRLQNEAALASVDKASTLTEVEALRKKAKEYEALASLTGELEGAKKAIEKANSKSVGVQIGAIAVKKGLKPSDIVKQWDVNGDGRLDKDEVTPRLDEFRTSDAVISLCLNRSAWLLFLTACALSSPAAAVSHMRLEARGGGGEND